MALRAVCEVACRNRRLARNGRKTTTSQTADQGSSLLISLAGRVTLYLRLAICIAGRKTRFFARPRRLGPSAASAALSHIVWASKCLAASMCCLTAVGLDPLCPTCLLICLSASLAPSCSNRCPDLINRLKYKLEEQKQKKQDKLDDIKDKIDGWKNVRGC